MLRTLQILLSINFIFNLSQVHSRFSCGGGFPLIIQQPYSTNNVLPDVTADITLIPVPVPMPAPGQPEINIIQASSTSDNNNTTDARRSSGSKLNVPRAKSKSKSSASKKSSEVKSGTEEYSSMAINKTLASYRYRVTSSLSSSARKKQQAPKRTVSAVLRRGSIGFVEEQKAK